jgi:hypothetical protein
MESSSSASRIVRIIILASYGQERQNAEGSSPSKTGKENAALTVRWSFTASLGKFEANLVLTLPRTAFEKIIDRFRFSKA